jgi:hypothetical protein
MRSDKVLLAILVLSVIVSLFTLYQRAGIERPYNHVELVADYDKYKMLADDMGISIEDALRMLKDAGVTTVAIKEETLGKVRKAGYISVMELWELKEQWILREELNEIAQRIKDSNLDPSGTVVILPRDRDAYERINQPLRLRAKGYRDWSGGGAYAITISGRYEDLEDLAVGFDYDKFEQAQRLGLNIAARPFNYKGITEGAIEELFEKFEKYPVTSIIFDGKQALGYPDNLEATADMIEKTGIVIGPIETWVQLKHIDQAGLDDLIRLSGYRAVRVFSLNEAEANKVTPKEVMDRWFRAVDERNLRLVYLNPKIEDFKSPDENFETNRFYIEEFAGIITDRGFKLDRVVPMKDYNIGRTRMLIITAGIVAGAVLLLDSVFKIGKKYLYGLLLLGMAGSAALYVIMPGLAEKAFALGAAVVFPSIAMVYITHHCKSIGENGKSLKLAAVIGHSIIELLKVSAISLIGAAFVASLLSATPYLLEMDIFRGVKIAHIIPVGVFIIAYFLIIGYKRDQYNSLQEEIEALFNTSIVVKYALLAAIAAVGAYLYLGRTGHTAGAPIFELEVQVRTFLEQTLAARPRTKEFLVAHPAMIIMIAAALTRYKSAILPLGLAATIGQVSMVNSFCHLRTPLYMSAWRTAYGIGFGIVFGVLGIIFIGILIHVYNAYIVRGRTGDV